MELLQSIFKLSIYLITYLYAHYTIISKNKYHIPYLYAPVLSTIKLSVSTISTSSLLDSVSQNTTINACIRAIFS